MDLIILLVAIAFLAVMFTKPIFSRFNIPLSFSAMFIGLLLGMFQFWQKAAVSETFEWFANIGMLFMIFSMLFQFKKSRKHKEKGLGVFLVKSGIIIIFTELLILVPLIYYFLESNIISALLISLIFTTVSEPMVIPFLKKFKIINTKLGKSIVGIGIFDNIFEYLVILIASLYSVKSSFNISSSLIVLAVSGLVIIIIKEIAKTGYIKNIIKKSDSNSLFLFSVALLFLLSGILSYIGLEFLGAVIAAILVKNLIMHHNDKFAELKENITVYSDGFFGPVFFLWVGITTNLSYILQKPILALLFVLIGFIAKMIPVLISTSKKLGIRSSVILGVALKFGSGIIFIKLLFENDIITQLTYTLAIAAILIYRIINPFLLSFFISKWKKFIV